MANSLELKQELRDLVDKMSALHQTAETDNRAFDTDERAKWDRMVDSQTSLEQRIADAERLEAYKRSDTYVKENFKMHEERSGGDQDSKEDYDKVFDRYLRHGRNELSAEERTVLEKRNQIIADPIKGGYAVNDMFAAQMVKTMSYENGFLNIGRIVRTSGGNPINYPLLDDTAAIGSALGETVAAPNVTFDIGQVIVGAHKYTSGVFTMSGELIEDNNYNLQAEVSMIAAKRLGRIVRDHMTLGNGGGLVGGIPSGITQDATVSGVTIAANTISYDKLVDIVTALDPAYYNNARFVFNHRTMGEIRKLVDTTGQPLWRPAMIQGEPDRILGYQYELVSSMPDMDTAGKVPILFGDFQNYIIRIARDFQLKRSEERFMEQDLVAYVGFMRIDAKLVAPKSVQSLAVA